MLHRSFPLRVAVVVGLTILGGFLSFGREAKSSLRPLFVDNTVAAHPFRHMRPFHLRLVAPAATPFTASTTVSSVGYTDASGQTTVWNVLSTMFEPGTATMLLLLEPKDPRKSGILYPGPAATGTGTIIVTTANPTTNSPAPGISVGAINNPECP